MKVPLKSIQDYLATQPVLKAYLFGSVLSDRFSDESDIDILVALDYKNGGADFYNFLSMQEHLSVLLKRKVDLVSENGISKLIKPIIDKEKQLIYERLD